LVKADVAALDRILAADYVFTDSDGQSHTKAQSLASHRSGEVKFESFTINEMKPRILGDVAIVHGLSTEKSSYQGKDTSGRYRWTDVFAKRGGRWQAVATHVSKVANR
jgi:ketosteroid isomerase-like protein